MKTERVQQLVTTAQAATSRVATARGAFAQRPQVSPRSRTAALQSQARTLVQARNSGEVVLADLGDAGTEIQGEADHARNEYTEAQAQLATAEQGESEGGLSAVGGRTGAGIAARRRATEARLALQRTQGQGDTLDGARQELQTEVDQASNGTTLLQGFEGDERDEAATALETAQSQVGPPKRKATKASLLKGGLVGGAVGATIGGALGALGGAIGGAFFGSAGLGAAIGAGAGALLGGLFGSIGGAAIASRTERKAIPSAGTRDLRSEGEYDDVNGGTDVALAPERLRALNQAAPAPVPLGSNGTVLDASEPAQREQRAAGASLATGAIAGRAGVIPEFRGSLPGISETDDDMYDAMERVRGESEPAGPVSAPPGLSSIAQDDEGEAAARAEDERERQLAAQKAQEEQQRQKALRAERQLATLADEEGAVAGSGALTTRASLAAQAESTPQMSEEERAIFEQGLAFKESGQDADAVSGTPATAQAMFGTDKLNEAQAFALQKKKLQVAGKGDVARLLAGPPTASGTTEKSEKKRRSRRPRVREISDEELDASASPAAASPTDTLEPAVPTQAVIGGFDSLSDENQAYYARLLSSDSGISPGQAMSMAQRRQAASAADTAAPPEVASVAPTPSVATYETGKPAPGLLSRAYNSVRSTVGDALLSAGVANEFDGWSAPTPDMIPKKPASSATPAATPDAQVPDVAQETPASAPEPQMESVLDKIDTSEAGKARYTAQYNRAMNPEPTLEDWVDTDDRAIRGPGTASPTPAAAPATAQAPATGGLLGGMMSFFRGAPTPVPNPSPAPSSGYGSGTSSPEVTPAPTPLPPTDDTTPTPVDPRSAAYSNMTGEEAATLGRQRGVAMGEARRQASAESQARTKSRIQNEQTWYGSAWEYLSSGLMTKEERDEERKQTMKKHRDEVRQRWLS